MDWGTISLKEMVVRREHGLRSRRVAEAQLAADAAALARTPATPGSPSARWCSGRLSRVAVALAATTRLARRGAS